MQYMIFGQFSVKNTKIGIRKQLSNKTEKKTKPESAKITRKDAKANIYVSLQNVKAVIFEDANFTNCTVYTYLSKSIVSHIFC